MKLISLNIELNKHLDRIIPFLENERPDIFCAQEILEKDVPTVATAMGYEFIFQATSYVSHHYYPEQNGMRFGVAIFAKHIPVSGVHFYVGSAASAELPFAEYSANPANNEHSNKAFVWIDAQDEQGMKYRIATTHLPVTPMGASTLEQIQATKSLLAALHPLGEVILIGDMNAPRGNETFSLLADAYTDAIPAEYTTSLDQNLHRVKGLQYMVDGLFLSPVYIATDVRLVDGLSDHMAIVTTVAKK